MVEGIRPCPCSDRLWDLALVGFRKFEKLHLGKLIQERRERGKSEEGKGGRADANCKASLNLNSSREAPSPPIVVFIIEGGGTLEQMTMLRKRRQP